MRQNRKLPASVKTFVICLLALLALSFVLRPFITTDAQEKKSTETIEDNSLTQPEGVGRINQENPVVSELAPNGSSCSWTSDAVYPITVQDQATAVAGSTLYSFSGQGNSVFTANSYKYNGTAWTAIANYPTAVVGAGAASDGTSVYIIGGVAAGSIFQTAVNRYNPTTDTYTAVAPVTAATWNHITLFLNGKIYKIGGSTSAGSTDIVEIYDIASNTWTAGASLPQPVSFGHGFVKGGFLYVAGGLNGSVALLKTYRYDPAANTWDDAAIADLPQTRWAGVSSKVPYGNTGAWTIAGGFVNGTALTNVSPTVVEWESASNTWTTNVSDMLSARFRGNGGVLGTSFYHIGGGPPNFTGTNDNQKLTCVSGVAVISAGTVNITGESCGTPNGAPDPGETLTITLPITNTGDTATTNLTATLQATGGVMSAVTQSYGVVAAGGTPVTRNFTFTVSPTVTCGGTVTLTFNLTDGATSYGTVTRVYTTGTRTVSLTQNFDSVTAPALPTGWSSVQTSGTGISWTTSTVTPSSTPNAAFGNEVATVNAAALVSPAVAITSADAQISFKNQYNLETNFDGTVLEYSIDNGTTWTDVVTGGGSFVSGGYTGTVSTAFMSPIGGRMAWSGASTGYVTTVVNLPASLNGQSARFRWLTASDSSVVATGSAGQWIDDVQVLGGRVCQSCTTGACQLQRRSDFNGDGLTDYGVFRPSSGVWYVQPNGAGGATGVAFGQAGDKLQPADFDGDGKADFGIFRSGMWYWIKSSDNTVQYRAWGAAGDIPVAGDYVGGSQAEVAVYRPANGVWYLLNLADNSMTAVQWGGAASDVPALGDFDGDCKLDLAVRRTTNENGAGGTRFYILQSMGGVAQSIQWGRDDMAMAIADYDGDGKSDVGVVNTVGGLLNWYVFKFSGTGVVLFNGTQFGQAGDIVTVGNYDADAKADLSIYRPATGLFAYRSTVSGIETQRIFGSSADVPTARAAQYPLP